MWAFSAEHSRGCISVGVGYGDCMRAHRVFGSGA